VDLSSEEKIESLEVEKPRRLARAREGSAGIYKNRASLRHRGFIIDCGIWRAEVFLDVFWFATQRRGRQGVS